MSDLTTVANAKLRLHYDDDDDDADIQLAISGASAALSTYLKLDADAYPDPTKIPADIENATLLLVGIMRRDPDGSEMEKWQLGNLPFPVTALVYARRMLTCA